MRRHLQSPHVVLFLVSLPLLLHCGGGGFPTAPRIQAQPQDQTVDAGQKARFTVIADGKPDPDFQWFKDQTPIEGAKQATLEYGPVQASDHGIRFQVVASNSMGKMTSKEAVLYVSSLTNENLAILEEPQGQNVTAGQDVIFQIKVSGQPSFQWKRDDKAISGATQSTYTLAKAQLVDDGAQFSVSLIQGTQKLESQKATLRVKPAIQESAPQITEHPKPISVEVGESAQFSVAATGEPAPSYQWYRNDQAIPGETQAVTRVDKTQLSDHGSRFRVTVTNTLGNIQSEVALLTVSEIQIAPQISKQPQSITVQEGAPAAFSVTASGVPQPAYQWTRNGGDIPGATQNSYTLPQAQKSHSGDRFSVRVSNLKGSVNSDEALLSVESQPDFTLQFSHIGSGSLSGELLQTVAVDQSSLPVIATADTGHLFNFWAGLPGLPPTTPELIIQKVNQNLNPKAYFAKLGVAALGEMGPNIRGFDQSGAQVAMSDLLGKIILLEVVREDCGLCKDNAPLFEALYKKHQGKGIECITVMYAASSYKKVQTINLQNWINSAKMTMRVQNDDSGVFKSIAVTSYIAATNNMSPCVIVLDRNFVVRGLSNDMATAEGMALGLAKK